MPFQSLNPATGEVEATFEEHTDEQVEQTLAASVDAFERWRRAPFAERATHMREAARYLRSQRDRFAGLMTSEMGKPIRQSEAEVEKCAWCCDFYA